MLLSWLLVATTIKCQYQFNGMPVSTLELYIDENEEPASSATIKMGEGAKSHKETVTPDTRKSDELVHAWLSKESTENSVELIIFRQPQNQGDSVLINHHVPFAQEIWGRCSF